MVQGHGVDCSCVGVACPRTKGFPHAHLLDEGDANMSHLDLLSDCGGASKALVIFPMPKEVLYVPLLVAFFYALKPISGPITLYMLLITLVCDQLKVFLFNVVLLAR